MRGALPYARRSHRFRLAVAFPSAVLPRRGISLRAGERAGPCRRKKGVPVPAFPVRWASARRGGSLRGIVRRGFCPDCRNTDVRADFRAFFCPDRRKTVARAGIRAFFCPQQMNSVNLFSLCSFSFRTEILAAAMLLIMRVLLERESAKFDDSLSGKVL